MDDLISRQAAIDALGERPLVWDEWADEYELGQRNQYDSDKFAIETLPSAERHGRWEDNGDFWVNCSVCGEAVLKNDHDPLLRSTELYRYCPSCGARMDLDEVTERYCDRNLCATMEANGKDCEDCPANGGEVEE